MRNPNEIKTVITTCPHCGAKSTVKAKAGDLMDWALGKPIQRAMPYLSEDERELLISGCCVTCWNNLFPVDD